MPNCEVMIAAAVLVTLVLLVAGHFARARFTVTHDRTNTLYIVPTNSDRWRILLDNGSVVIDDPDSVVPISGTFGFHVDGPYGTLIWTTNANSGFGYLDGTTFWGLDYRTNRLKSYPVELQTGRALDIPRTTTITKNSACCS